MLNSKSFLAVDFGATSLKVAEFEVNESGGLTFSTLKTKPLSLQTTMRLPLGASVTARGWAK